ncbi:hypothetical protein T06_12553 [Trichinella sp. T6]|nr:hypothetical protein T06_12553 [Trichinella sp. T6]
MHAYGTNRALTSLQELSGMLLPNLPYSLADSALLDYHLFSSLSSYRKSKNTVWRRRRAIRHHQVLKDIGCFEWVPLRLYSKVPSDKYLCGRNKQQMAFKKIVAVKRDPPLNSIMKQMKPVKISRKNRIVPPKDVILLTIYL